MSKLIFCDTNQNLVIKVQELFEKFKVNKWSVELEAVCQDIFECQNQNIGYKICTASNPNFNMSGGLDKLLKDKFSNEIYNPKEFSWSNNLFYTISVDNNLKVTRQTVARALTGIFAYRYKELIFSGLGTKIGGMTEKEFVEILEIVLNANIFAELSEADLSKADLSGADLSGADLSEADLRWANLSKANLSGADLRWANLSKANLSEADLSEADLRWANLRWANLSKANLSEANLSEADLSVANLSKANLSKANLSGADLRWANLSQVKNFFNSLDWLKANFETDDKGIIVYKRIGNGKTEYTMPKNWIIEAGSFIEELGVNPLPTVDCGSGVNFATLDWCKKQYETADLWKCRINWMDMPAIVVPYNTNGKARCQTLELLEIIND